MNEMKDTNKPTPFKTLMLFRCTNRERAEQFCRGDIYLGSPRQWINIEKSGNKGQGDVLEGVFLSTYDDDNSEFVRYLRSEPSIEFFSHNGITFFRHKEVLDKRCLCLYGLHDNSFVKEYDSNGKAHYRTSITKNYFSSFTDYKTREASYQVDPCKQPVVILISNPYEFFNRIVTALRGLGVEENEIIIYPVRYLDRYGRWLTPSSPSELLIKDNAFKEQSEVRIIVNSNSELYLEYMRTHNNTISIGLLTDITEIYNYYFEDMKLERWKNNGMLISLPEAKEISIYNMSFFELMDLISNTIIGSVTITGGSEHGTLQDKLKVITDLIHDKFGVFVFVDENKNIQMFNMSQDLLDQFQVRFEKPIMHAEFERHIDTLINAKKYTEAESLCKSVAEDKQMLGAISFCLGKVYVARQEGQKAIEAYSKAFALDYKRVESLNCIALCYFHQSKYENALNTYKLIQDEIGYFKDIWINMGICCIHIQQYDKAIEYFDKAITSDANNAAAYYNRGVAYHRLNQINKAKADYYRSLKLDPTNELYRNAILKYLPDIEK